MSKIVTGVRNWFKRLTPITSLNYVLLDVCIGFSIITWLLYVKTPPSVSASAVLDDTLYKYIGPPTYGIILMVCCLVGGLTAGMRDKYMQGGFYLVLGSMALWVSSLLASCLYSNAGADETNRVLVTCIFIAMLISGCLRWLVAHNRNGRLR